MAQFTDIMASEYNAVQTKVNNIVGSGSGNKGYGGSMTSSAVAAGNLITEAQFDNLRSDIDKAVRHQTGLLSSLTNVSQGNVIYWATLLSYDLKADEITANSDTVYTGATVGSFVSQVSVINGGSTTLSAGWGLNTANQRYGQQSYNVTFTTADKARQFFNSGGYLKITLSQTGSSGNTKSTGWIGIVNNMAAQAFTFDKTNYRQGVAGSPTTWAYQRFDTTNPYTENYGYMRFTYVNATTIGVLVQMVDQDAGDQTGIGPAVDEQVVGIDITAGLEYRKSIDQFVAEIPSFTVPAWTLNA